jgi:hypothetical protein
VCRYPSTLVRDRSSTRRRENRQCIFFRRERTGETTHADVPSTNTLLYVRCCSRETLRVPCCDHCDCIIHHLSVKHNNIRLILHRRVMGSCMTCLYAPLLESLDVHVGMTNASASASPIQTADVPLIVRQSQAEPQPSIYQRPFKAALSTTPRGDETIAGVALLRRVNACLPVVFPDPTDRPSALFETTAHETLVATVFSVCRRLDRHLGDGKNTFNGIVVWGDRGIGKSTVLQTLTRLLPHCFLNVHVVYTTFHGVAAHEDGGLFAPPHLILIGKSRKCSYSLSVGF